MGIAHKKDSELKKEIEEAASKITIGAEYWHYKSRNNTYKVTGLGFLEATNELCVIYQTLYGEKLTFLRPLSVWLEDVEWDGKMVPRFNRI